MKNTLNSRRLWEISKTYVVDGRCVKSRSCRKELVNEKMIEEMVQAHDNIVIQNGQEMKIYCDDKFLQGLNHVIECERQYNTSNNLFTAYQKGQIEIFVKYSKKETTKKIKKVMEIEVDEMMLIGLVEILEFLSFLDSI